MASQALGAKTTFGPLVVMAAAFFVPAYRDCGGDSIAHSPAHYAAIDPVTFAWVVPVFLAAAAMALLTVRVLAAREVERGVRRGALVTVALLALVNVGAVSAYLASDTFPRVWWLFAAVLGAGAAALLIRRARGKNPFAIWDHLVAAFGCVAATSGPATFLGSSLLLESSDHHAAGAYLFVGATAFLLVASSWRALR